MDAGAGLSQLLAVQDELFEAFLEQVLGAARAGAELPELVKPGGELGQGLQRELAISRGLAPGVLEGLVGLEVAALVEEPAALRQGIGQLNALGAGSS